MIDREFYNVDQLVYAVNAFFRTGVVSATVIQKALKVNAETANKMMDDLEDACIIGAPDYHSPRELLITREEWGKMLRQEWSTLFSVQMPEVEKSSNLADAMDKAILPPTYALAGSGGKVPDPPKAPPPAVQEPEPQEPPDAKTESDAQSPVDGNIFYSSSFIDYMEGVEFEEFCAYLLKKLGYSARLTKASGDQGVDIIAVRDGIKYAVQCKRYSSPLGNKPVQEAFTGKTIYGCNCAVVMTNSAFTDGAIKAAEATGVTLWDGDTIKRFMLQVGIMHPPEPQRPPTPQLPPMLQQWPPALQYPLTPQLPPPTYNGIQLERQEQEGAERPTRKLTRVLLYSVAAIFTVLVLLASIKKLLTRQKEAPRAAAPAKAAAEEVTQGYEDGVWYPPGHGATFSAEEREQIASLLGEIYYMEMVPNKTDSEVGYLIRQINALNDLLESKGCERINIVFSQTNGRLNYTRQEVEEIIEGYDS